MLDLNRRDRRRLAGALLTFSAGTLMLTAVSPPAPKSRGVGGAATGGYASAASSEGAVVAAALYAGRQHAADSGRQVELRGIVHADRRMVRGGVGYRLCLDVVVDRTREEVSILVFEDVRHERSLIRWDLDRCR